MTAILLSISLLLYTPVQGEMTISVTSNLDVLDYDVENIHLRLEKLESRWQISPIDSKLSVEKLHARRLVMTMRSASKKAGDSALPEKISLPFPIKIQQAEVLEVLIVTPTTEQVLRNVQFDLEADAKTIQLNRLSVGTAYGQVEAAINLGTSHPFALAGTISIKKTPVAESAQQAINRPATTKQIASKQTEVKQAEIKPDEQSVPYDIQVNLSGDLTALRFDSNIDFVLENKQLALKKAALQNEDAVANMHLTGELGLAGEYPLKANAQMLAFNPALLGDYPEGQLNLDLNVFGNVAPIDTNTGLQVLLATKESHLLVNNQQHPLIGEGRLMLVNNSLQDIDFKINFANNSIAANGALGLPDSQLNWRADLPDLTIFNTQFSGEVHADGALTGAFENLAFRMNVAATKLQLANRIKLEKLTGKAAMQAGEQGNIEATFNASGLKMGQNPALSADFIVQGTRATHQAKIQAVEAQSNTVGSTKALQFETTLQGGLQDNQWNGFIQTLRLTGDAPITLTAPAKLGFTGQDIRLDNVALQFAKGHALVDALQAGKSGFVSKGKLSNVALEDIPPSLFMLPSNLQGSPIFSAQWHIDAIDAANGNLNVQLESGDLNVLSPGGVAKPLGLQKAQAALLLQNNQATLDVLVEGQQLGRMQASVNTALTKVESGFALMADAPLTMTGAAELNTLAWLPIADSLTDAHFDGELRMQLQADGTMQKPNLRGSVKGQNLQFTLPSQGVVLADGVLDAIFEHDALHINQAVWKGGEGFLRTSGTLSMQNQQPHVVLDWVAEHFTAISGTDRLLTINGTGKTTLDENLFSIAGDFKIAKGLLELPSEDIPTLADDVVVLGQVNVIPESALKILLSGLRIDLGDDFRLHGRGMDAQLTGAVTLTGLTQYHPHAEGVIRIKKGTYMAYGQILNITQGNISFSGPADNPGLSIRAMRNAVRSDANLMTTHAESTTNTGEVTGRNFNQTTSVSTQAVNAGVEITGSGLNPIVKLVSEPNVPDTEKLSWLVLGHGTDLAGKNDFAMLSLAAGAVLSKGDSVPLQTKLARAAGLDDFSVGGTDAETASLTFGKRLSSQLYLSYEKSISGLLDVARLTFNITPRWALQAETGTASAVDALYTFSFR